MESNKVLLVSESNKLHEHLNSIVFSEDIDIRICSTPDDLASYDLDTFSILIIDTKFMNGFNSQFQKMLLSSNLYKIFLNTSYREHLETFSSIESPINDFLVTGYSLKELSNRIEMILFRIKTNRIEKSNRYHSNFFSNAEDALIITDLDGNILDINEVYCNILGRSKEDILKLSVSDIDTYYSDTLFRKFWMNKDPKKRYLLNSIHKAISGNEFPVEVQTWKDEIDGEMVVFGIVKQLDNAISNDHVFNQGDLKYRKMFEENRSIMLIINPANGKIEDANDSAVNFYGYPYEKLTSMSISDINILTDNEVKAEMMKARAGNRSHFIFKHRTANNLIKDVNVFTNRINIRGKDLLYSIIHDITREKAAEKALVKAKETAELYLDMAGSIFVNIDANENILMMNQKGLVLLGYNRDEVVGKNWFDLCIKADEREKIRHVFRKVIDNETDYPEHFENDIIAKDGREMTISWHNTYLRDDNGKIVSVLSSGIDITHRITSERKLKENEELLRTLVENQGEGIVILSEDFYFTYANPSAEKIFGMKREELCKLNITDIFSPEDIERAMNYIDTMILHGKASFEIPLQRPDATMPLLVTITPRKNREGKLTGTYCVFRDFSEQKAILKRLSEQKVNHTGLIPICASCFKIRDDEEKGKWESPTDFLSQKVPELKFTHSICPECQKKLYPGLNLND